MEGKEILSLDTTLSAHWTYLPSQWLPVVSSACFTYSSLLGENRRYPRHPGYRFTWMPLSEGIEYGETGTLRFQNFSELRPLQAQEPWDGHRPFSAEPRMDDFSSCNGHPWGYRNTAPKHQHKRWRPSLQCCRKQVQW